MRSASLRRRPAALAQTNCASKKSAQRSLIMVDGALGAVGGNLGERRGVGELATLFGGQRVAVIDVVRAVDTG
jgi:hypothetical protein